MRGHELCGTVIVDADAGSAPCIFQEHWWLDAATGHRWRYLESKSVGGFVARLGVQNETIPLSRRASIKQPPLTPMATPWIVRAQGYAQPGALTQKGREKLMADLVCGMPDPIECDLIFDGSFRELLPFVRCNFLVSVLITHRIDRPGVSEFGWARLHQTTRNRIRKASDRGNVEQDSDPERAVATIKTHLATKAKRLAVNEEVLKLVLAETSERRAGTGFYFHSCGKIEAFIHVVWDRSTTYFLISSRSNDAQQGAIPRLLWSAIENARESGRAFDFDFSPLGEFFGAEQVFRWRVRKLPRHIRLLRTIAGRL